MTILDYDTVALNEEKNALVIIDQTKLPYSIEILELTDLKEIWDAIYLLKVRGAPAIGVTAAIAIYLEARKIAMEANDFDDFYKKFVYFFVHCQGKSEKKSCAYAQPLIFSLSS